MRTDNKYDYDDETDDDDNDDNDGSDDVNFITIIDQTTT